MELDGSPVFGVHGNWVSMARMKAANTSGLGKDDSIRSWFVEEVVVVEVLVEGVLVDDGAGSRSNVRYRCSEWSKKILSTGVVWLGDGSGRITWRRALTGTTRRS